MSRGKRYNGEQKLNMKKVFAVIITIIFHFVTICTINKNGRGMLTENEE